MNEQLKQIAIKAQVEHCVSHVRLQEFAELLVQECIDTLYKDGCSCLPIDRLKEHFGVK